MFTGATNGNTNIKVAIHANGTFDHPRVLYVDPDWSYMEFLNAASQRLEMVPVANRVYNANGVEVSDTMMLADDDMLFFSHGEAFIPPKFTRTPSKSSRTRPDGSTAVGDDGDEDGDGDGADGSGGGKNRTGKNTRRGSMTSLGPFLIGDMLGKGGFGEVRVGTNQLNGEKVALKFLRKSEIMNLVAAERTATEIQVLSTLKHPHIIQLVMHLETPKYVVLAFELMNGGDLYKYLCARGTTTAEIALTEPEARKVFLQVCDPPTTPHTIVILRGESLSSLPFLVSPHTTH